MSRLALGAAAEFVQLDRPFSNFAFIDQRFAEAPVPIRRLFSQARARNCRSLVIESVPPTAAVLDEVNELTAMASDYVLGALYRVSFWKSLVASTADVTSAAANSCIGYAILKHDRCPSWNADKWHIFESVVGKHDHKHNYTPCDTLIGFRVLERELTVSGVLYGQQNGLNKACAQVALRSACANYLRDYDLPYSRINRLAWGGDPIVEPGKGLTTTQTAKVLAGLGINFTSLSYDKVKNPPAAKEGSLPTDKERNLQEIFPYQRAIYSGIEAGVGSLLIFSLPDREVEEEKDRRHMIVCFGHTFNEDTWAPTAEVDYFGADSIRYTPSDAWMSSFLIHDDNFGSNLCIPKAYLKPDLVRCAITLLPPNFKYNGFIAELIAANFFYSVTDHLAGSHNVWYKRLLNAARSRRLILRVVPVTKRGYLEHLQKMDDWDYRREDEGALAELEKLIVTDAMWMIEVSFPDLFPTNKRKVGEVLLDASQPIGRELDFALFVLGRLPGSYVLLDREEPRTEPHFLSVPSLIESHTEVLIR